MAVASLEGTTVKEEQIMETRKQTFVLFVNKKLDVIKVPNAVSLYLTAEILCKRDAVIHEILFCVEGVTDPYECREQLRKALRRREWFKEEEEGNCHTCKFVHIRITSVGYLRGLTGEQQKKGIIYLNTLSFPGSIYRLVTDTLENNLPGFSIAHTTGRCET